MSGRSKATKNSIRRALARPREARALVQLSGGVALAAVVTLAAAATAAAPTLAPGAVPEGPWSVPAQLSACALDWPPAVAFPQSDPFMRSGPGTIVFDGTPGDCPSVSLARAQVQGVPLSDTDSAGAAEALVAGGIFNGVVSGPTFATGTTVGKVVVGLQRVSAGPGGAAAGAVVEGAAGQPFSAPVALHSASRPVSAVAAWLGDVAVASATEPVAASGGAPAREGHIALRMQRHYERGLSAPEFIPTGMQPIAAVTVALDFRTDALLVWTTATGRILATYVPQNRRPHAIQQLASTSSQATVSAVLSDDERAIVAWTSQRPRRGGGHVEIARVAISTPGVVFGRPMTLAHYDAPAAAPTLPQGSIELVRLSDEGVMLGWTAVSDGYYVVRVARVSLSGVRRAVTVGSASGADSILAGLLSGPQDDMLALWTSTPRIASGPDAAHVSVVAARGLNVIGPTPAFAAPQTIAGPGALSDPTAAIDPSTDRAVAVWLDGQQPASVSYSISTP